MFSQKIQFVKVGEDPHQLPIPPPQEEEGVVFPEKVQFVNVGEDELALSMPPPLENAVFDVKQQFETVGEE